MIRTNRKLLTEREYQEQKLEELEKKKENGTLDEKEINYYKWLKGERPKEPDYRTHKLAKERIHYLHKYMTLRQIADTSSRYSYSAICNLYAGRFKSVSDGYAKSILHGLKRVVDNIKNS